MVFTKDQLIPPPVCHRCGDCCQSMSLHMRVNEKMKQSNEEILKWFNVHKGVYAYMRGDQIIVFFELPCKHLEWDGKLAVCGIQDDKPQNCREGFNCVDNIDFIAYRRKRFGR